MEASQAQRQQPPAELTEEAAIAALTVASLSGLSAEAYSAYAVQLLGPLGISAAAASAAAGLIFPHLLLGASAVALVAAATSTEPDTERERGAAERLTYRGTAVRQAAYLTQAARRLSEGGSLEAERRYLEQHLAAERARRDVAVRVDRAAEEFGPLLGWHSVRDEATTAGCRAAHGSNFEYDRPPMVEGAPVYPGTLHGGACRCRPGRPFPDAPVLSPLQTVPT